MGNKKSVSKDGVRVDYTRDYWFSWYQGRGNNTFCPCRQFGGAIDGCSRPIAYGDEVVIQLYQEYVPSRGVPHVLKLYWRPAHFKKHYQLGIQQLTRNFEKIFAEKSERTRKNPMLVKVRKETPGRPPLEGVESQQERNRQLRLYAAYKQQLTLDTPTLSTDRRLIRDGRILLKMEAIEKWLEEHGGRPVHTPEYSYTKSHLRAPSYTIQ